MRVQLQALDVDDRLRRALRAHVGEPGLATREEVRTWIDAMTAAAAEDLVSDLETQEGR